MRKIYCFFSFIVIVNISFSQLNCITNGNAEHNLRKYWIYRERLKDFVVPGNDYGCSIPATGRTTVPAGGELEYGDEPAIIGYYIGMLATEYYLLSQYLQDSAGINQKQRDLVELFYALNAVDRLDIDAEAYWREFYAHQTFHPEHSDLNGFLIRDDVPAGFTNQWENGDYVENDVNKGLVPLPDKSPLNTYRAKINNSALTGAETGIYGQDFGPACSEENNRRGGPNTISIDEITQLYIGLALVSKFISPTLTANNMYFPDGQPYLQQEAINIANRIYTWQSKNGNVILNPVTGECGTGIEFNSFQSWWNSLFTPCKCNAGGSDVGSIGRQFEPGMNHANTFIGNGFNYFYFPTLYPRWFFIYKDFFLGNDQEFMILAQAVIGHVWQTGENFSVGYLALRGELSHSSPGRCTIYPLLYEALWNENVLLFPSNYYEQLLNMAPCFGNVGYDGNSEWSGGDRVLYGRTPANTSDNFDGLDYLLYFNLFNIAYPVMNPHIYYDPYYRYMKAKDLCQPYLIKTDYAESDEKNFYAADSIKAGAIAPDSLNYTILNDNDTGQVLPASRAQVVYKAGHNIDLRPGFEVRTGALFDASIDTSIHAFHCDNCVDTVNLENQFFPVDTITDFNYFSTDTFKVCDPPCITLHFFGINGDTGGIKNWHWDFGNGDTSNTYNPSVTYCNPRHLDSLTGNLDTTFVLTLIVTTDTGNYQDTLTAFVFLSCPGPHHTPIKYSENKKQENTNDTTTFEVLNNVINANSKIVYHLPQQENLVITITNLFGEKMGTLVQTIQEEGNYALNINNTSYPAGMYFVTMQTNNFVQTKKLVIMR